MFSVTVFLKKADGWCYLLSHFDEGSPITACAKSSRHPAYLKQELEQKLMQNHIQYSVCLLWWPRYLLELKKPKQTTGLD